MRAPGQCSGARFVFHGSGGGTLPGDSRQVAGATFVATLLHEPECAKLRICFT